MNSSKVFILTVLLLPLLAGCWGISFKADTPSEYGEKKEKANSLYGSTKEDIIRVFGKPGMVEHRGTTTYFIYEWKRSDKDIVFFVLPIPIGGGRAAIHWYCLLLEFDDDNHLINHQTAYDSDDDPPPWGRIGNPMDIKKRNCLDIFELPTKQLIKEIGAYCPNAELGHADAQKHIADIFYFGLFNVEKDPVRAYVWYKLASTNGDIEASSSINKMAKEMSVVQLYEAQQLLVQWEPGHCESDLLERHRELIKEK
jgi:hypothetical protein